MKAIIPTGGRGTRMRPLTFSSNKHFLPVANKPLIYYPIEAVAESGVKEVGITYNVGSLDEVKLILGNGSRWGLKFTYILQEKPAGLANIIEVCEEFIGEDKFFLHLGDNIFADGIKDLVERFEGSTDNALVTMIAHKDNTRLGVPYFDEKGKFTKYVEKPKDPPNSFGIPGLYFFDHNVFKAFKGEGRIQPSERGELEIGSLYNWLMDNGFSVDSMEYKGKWLDPGKFNDWIEANQYILDTTLESLVDESATIDSESSLENRVSVGKDCEIINSHLRGPVAIGDRVTIKNSFVGPFTSIDENCVLENSHIENSVLMRGVKIVEVKDPIDTSLIGTDSEVLGSAGPTSSMRLFIGEKSRIEV